jgi:hypothetical protein
VRRCPMRAVLDGTLFRNFASTKPSLWVNTCRVAQNSISRSSDAHRPRYAGPSIRRRRTTWRSRPAAGTYCPGVQRVYAVDQNRRSDCHSLPFPAVCDLATLRAWN